MFTTFLVFLGAGLGGSLRHGVNLLCGRYCGTEFPIGTLIINATGCFTMGLLAGWFAFRAGASHQPLRLFLTTGVLGGFTTFSAFSLDTALLWDRGQPSHAAFYVIASVVLAIAGCFAGLALIKSTS